MSDSQLNTPVVFLIFNRPDLTARVFEVIRAAQPRNLLVVADGPRPDRLGEEESCRTTRAIIDGVDWPCTVSKHYSEENLGCGRCVSRGLAWAFAQYEELIVLEDDCLPNLSFFRFCQELLHRYRDDERIMHIGGTNFLPDSPGRYSYYFSRYPHAWGWASWRRAWKFYDFAMVNWRSDRRQVFNNIFDRCDERRFWRKWFDHVSMAKHTWDHQWAYAMWRQSGMAVIPAVNMVSNIGFRSDATHTGATSAMANRAVHDMAMPLSHPGAVVRNRAADRYTFQTCYVPSRWHRLAMRCRELMSRRCKDDGRYSNVQE